jgi:hypothetical protein
MYIVSYMTKDERDVCELLKAARKEHADKDIRTQLRKLGSVFLTGRELSAQEAVFRLLGLTMLESNAQRVFVATNLPEDRIRFLKSREQLEQLNPDSDELFMTGLPQRYAARPKSLEHIYLADFAVEYAMCYKSNAQSEENDIPPNPLEDAQQFDKVITLLNKLGPMHHRKRRAILLTHKFSIHKEPDRFYHSELMLFIPWRCEDIDLLQAFGSYYEAYVANYELISNAKTKFYYHHSDRLLDAIDVVFDGTSLQSAWDSVAATQRQDNALFAVEGTHPETFIDCDDDPILNTTFINTDRVDSAKIPIQSVKLLADEDYYLLFRSLTNQEQHLFQHVLDWCRNKKLNDKTPPFYIFCTGGAWVGKSHLIKSLVQMANRELRKPGDNPDDVVTVLAAPTGTAAYNINGNTIHSAFLLSVDAKASSSLSSEKLAALRAKYSKLKVVIIDEVSMVGANLLVCIHERLSAIAGLTPSVPFANISILAFGDFQQLAPVCETPIYKAPKDPLHALANL